MVLLGSVVHTTTGTAKIGDISLTFGIASSCFQVIELLARLSSVTLRNVRYRGAAMCAAFSVIGGPLL